MATAISDTLTFSRTQAQTDSNGLTDTDGLVFANEALLDFKRRLIAKGVDAAQTQESFRNGTIGQGTYLYPTDMFFLKAIELNYTGTDPTGYRTAQQIDVSNLANARSFSWLRSNVSRNQPQFDDRGDQFEIFPTPIGSDNISQLIRIFYFLEPSEFTAVSDTIAYPENLDHRVLGWRISANYLLSIGKLDESDRHFEKYEERVRELIKTLSRGVQSPIQATGIPWTGYEF